MLTEESVCSQSLRFQSNQLPKIQSVHESVNQYYLDFVIQGLGTYSLSRAAKFVQYHWWAAQYPNVIV